MNFVFCVDFGLLVVVKVVVEVKGVLYYVGGIYLLDIFYDECVDFDEQLECYGIFVIEMEVVELYILVVCY